MKIAIDGLDKMPCAGRKIAVLGKMAELGETSEARHKEIGERLSGSSVDIAVGVCPEMKTMLAELRPDQEKHYFADKEGVAEFLLNNLLQNNDILLIKGARYSSKLYQVTDALLKGLEKHEMSVLRFFGFSGQRFPSDRGRRLYPPAAGMSGMRIAFYHL